MALSNGLLFAIFGAIFLIFYKFILFPRFISPLSKIPNAHWTVPFSPFWVLWTRYRSRVNQDLHAAHLKLGAVVRVAPNEISINDVAGLRTVYGGGFEKGEWYSIFDNFGVPCMFSSWHSQQHSARKRMISHTYSKSTVHNSTALAAQSRVILYGRLLPIIDAVSADLNGTNVFELWSATAMDGMTAYLFGLKNSSNFLQDPSYRRHWLGLYRGRKKYQFFPQELPRLQKYCKKLGVYLVPKRVDAANKEMEEWTQMLCDSTMTYMETSAAKDNDPANEPVVLSALSSGIDREKETKGGASILALTALKFKRVSLASEMMDHLAAGHDTSGVTLTFLSWELSRNLSLQDKLRAELLTLKPNMLMSNSPPRIPSSKDLDLLPLLDAVLKETLRLHAAIPGTQPRVTPFPSSTISGYTIPGGVRVSAQAFCLHRHAQAYPDPAKFDYTRWLDDQNDYSAEQVKERDRWFWPFSSGGRMCIGSNFALHEMKLVIAAVYSNFRTHVVDDEGIQHADSLTTGPTSNRLLLRFEKIADR